MCGAVESECCALGCVGCAVRPVVWDVRCGIAVRCGEMCRAVVCAVQWDVCCGGK